MSQQTNGQIYPNFEKYKKNRRKIYTFLKLKINLILVTPKNNMENDENCIQQTKRKQNSKTNSLIERKIRKTEKSAAQRKKKII